MKTLFKAFLVILCFGCSAPSTPKLAVLPKNMEESILYFQNDWTANELNSFKDQPEAKAIAEAHSGAGLWIRNNWIRGDRNIALTHYFKSMGVKHPDDISSIILTSLHRRLNHREIALDKQVEDYKAYWKPIADCEEEDVMTAVKNYNKFKVGDEISIYMPVDHASGSENAVILICPKVPWKFDPKNDLLLRGEVVNKYTINTPSNVFFKVKVKHVNRKGTAVLMQKVIIGAHMDFSLSGLTLN